MSRPNITPHTTEEMEAMSIRDLLNTTEHWTRAIGDSSFTDKEIEMVRQANRIYIRRREALRRAAPELLVAGEAVIAAWESGDLAGAVRNLAQAIGKAKGGE